MEFDGGLEFLVSLLTCFAVFPAGKREQKVFQFVLSHFPGIFIVA